jgi:muramoyltetrapeptide carboxypeptidase
VDRAVYDLDSASHIREEAVLKARALQKGDRVAIVAPASPFPRDAFERGVAEIERLGFEPVFDESVFARRGYVAGDASLRAASLLRVWADDSVRAVMVGRGGYGSVQMLPLLPVEAFRVPKIFVGYSDVTSILSFLSLSCGIVCFHGPSVAGCLGAGRDRYDADTLLRAVTRPEPLGLSRPAGLETVRPGVAGGPLLGGTLTQLAASLGTPYAFAPPEGFVLLVDEVGERPYRLDRMLTQLALAGVLGRARAIVFGELPGCDEPGGGPTALATIADVLRDFVGPVLFGLPSGHTLGAAITVPLGVKVQVVARPLSPELVFEEAAVV